MAFSRAAVATKGKPAGAVSRPTTPAFALRPTTPSTSSRPLADRPQDNNKPASSSASVFDRLYGGGGGGGATKRKAEGAENALPAEKRAKPLAPAKTVVPAKTPLAAKTPAQVEKLEAKVAEKLEAKVAELEEAIVKSKDAHLSRLAQLEETLEETKTVLFAREQKIADQAEEIKVLQDALKSTLDENEELHAKAKASIDGAALCNASISTLEERLQKAKKKYHRIVFENEVYKQQAKEMEVKLAEGIQEKELEKQKLKESSDAEVRKWKDLTQTTVATIQSQMTEALAKSMARCEQLERQLSEYEQ